MRPTRRDQADPTAKSRRWISLIWSQRPTGHADSIQDRQAISGQGATGIVYRMLAEAQTRSASSRSVTLDDLTGDEQTTPSCAT